MVNVFGKKVVSSVLAVLILLSVCVVGGGIGHRFLTSQQQNAEDKRRDQCNSLFHLSFPPTSDTRF